jgi:hypothetical protein
MRANLILLLTAATLAACGSATAPNEATGSLEPNAVSIPDAPRTSGGGGGGGGVGASSAPTTSLPNDGVQPPCLQALRLANDLLPGPVSCRR